MLRTLLLSLAVFHLAACSALPFFDNRNGSNANAGQAAGEPTVTVSVTGVEDRIADNIRAHVGLSRTRCTVPPELLQRRSRKTREEATKALQAFGYYRAQMTINIAAAPECPVAEINVDPGERIPVSKVELQVEGAAANDPDFKRMLHDLPLKEGEKLNHGKYSSTKSLIESTAAELGYLDGRFSAAKLAIDLESYSAEALLQYNSGERYRLGDIRIQQDPEVLREELIDRIIEAPAGENYRADQVVRIQNRLTESGYFSSVEARPRLSASADRTIPVDVVVKPAKRHKFSASFGFATDEGVRSRLGYTNRWWNDRGHRLGAEARLSQRDQGISANYQVPREHPADEWLRITAGARQQLVDTFDTLEARVSVNESKRRPWDIMENRFISLSRTDFEIGSERGVGTFLIPGIRWDRRVVDNELYPARGLDLVLEFRGAAGSFLADTSFVRSTFHAHYLRSFGPGFRAFLRGDLGTLWVDRFRALPPSERFFTGGDNTIRGYEFQELGPENNRGQVIGGQHLGVISLELEKSLTQNWGVAGFVDSGNAFGGPGSNTGLKTGVGMGLRWRSPVGPVRLDIAHPLDADDDTLFRIHFRIGPDL